MLFLVLSHQKVITLHLLIFTILARALGDWLFWKRVSSSMVDSGERGEAWQFSVKDILLSKTVSVGGLVDMIVDAGLDLFLVYMAFKASSSPILIFLVLCVCQAVSAPILGIVLHLFNKRRVRLFSMVVSAVAILAALEVNGVISPESYVDLFGLFHFTKSTAILLVLGAKCLLTGITVVGKATIAEVIKTETKQELSENFS